MTAWFDDLLDPKSFNDYCVNGLCVEASDKVTKIVTGVSLRDQLIDAAIAEHADCIIVHHPNGFWKGENCVKADLFYAIAVFRIFRRTHLFAAPRKTVYRP